MISHKLILELKQILEEDYGVKLSLEEAYEIGSTLIGLVELLVKIEAKPNLEMKGGVSK